MKNLVLEYRIARLERLVESRVKNEASESFSAKYSAIKNSTEEWHTKYYMALRKQIKALKEVKPKKSLFGKVKNQEEVDNAQRGIKARETAVNALDLVLGPLDDVGFCLEKIVANNDYDYYVKLNEHLPKLNKSIEAANKLSSSISEDDTGAAETLNNALIESTDISAKAAEIFKTDEFKKSVESHSKYVKDKQKSQAEYLKAQREYSQWTTKIRNALMDRDYSDPEVRQAIKDYGKEFFGVHDL